MEKRLLKGVLYSIVSALSFATLAVIIKIGYNSGLTTIQMLVMRFFFAFTLMGLALFLFRPALLKPSRVLITKAFFTGSILYTAQAYCFFSGIKFVSPNVVELILYLYPAAVTILSSFIFKEPLTKYKLVYIAIILIGFGFIFHDAFGSALKIKGVVYATLAMSIYSLYLVFIQIFVKNENPISFSFYTIAFAFVSFLCLSVWHLSVPSHVGQIIVGFLLGLIPTFSAIMFLFMAIDRIGSALASVFSSIEPVFTILFAYVLLGISLNEFQLIGGFLIITGVMMANVYHARRGLNG